MQRDYWYTNARAAEDLEPATAVGKRAGERTVRRLGCKPIKTGQYPVLFEAALAGSLISSLISAISGGSLYRKSSFLLDSLGKSVGASLLNIEELPHIIKAQPVAPLIAKALPPKHANWSKMAYSRAMCCPATQRVN